MIQPSDHQIIEAAHSHGAKLWNDPNAGTWLVLDQYGQANFNYGIFVSEAAAAFAYCEEHDCMPTVPEVEPPIAELRITKPPSGINLRAVVVTVLLVAVAVAVIATLGLAHNLTR